LAACATPAAPAAAPASPQPALASAPAPPGVLSQRERWNLPAEPYRIVGNIYSVGTAGLAAYLFTSPDGHILLDAALPESAAQIEANIQKLGFRLSDVKILLNSHAHFDHSGGLAQLKASTGASLAAMDGDLESLESGTYLGSEFVEAFRSPPVKVDRVLRDGAKVSLGGVVLTANLTPGHSRGCTTWTLKATEGERVLDVVIFCSATVAANRLLNPPQYEGIVADYRATFARVREMKADIPLAPHPEFFQQMEKQARAKSEGAVAFVDPAGLPALIDRLEADFEAQLAKAEGGVAAPARPRGG
jgi:metallo-beta-lactamase class B